MLDIKTVCTHDARKLAETLARLLEAEEHRVRVIYGRQSFGELEASRRNPREAVLLIWSPDAPSQTYMLEWARNIDPSRLVEIALAPGWPRIARKAPVIDFAGWRGVRGARAWRALNERLRGVARAVDPPDSAPKRTAMAIGLAGVAAVGAALVARVDETPATAPLPPSPPSQPVQAALSPPQHEPREDTTGMGGPLDAVEPPSVDDLTLPESIRPLARTQMPARVELSDFEQPELRPPTLLERLSALNPLRRSGDDED